MAMRSPIIRICLSCFLTAIIVVTISTVNISGVSARSLTSLNADIANLRARINRLEGEVRNLSRGVNRTNLPLPKNEAIPQPGNLGVVDGQVIGRSDPMFQRLATLLIELKEDVKDIDQRLNRIEQEMSITDN